MITNADITIYNKHFNAGAGKDEWLPTQIKGVWWHSSEEVTLAEKGLTGADKVSIRIPVDANTGGKQYISASDFEFVSNASELWTVTDGDFVYKGLTDLPFNELKKQEKYVKVFSFSENMFGLNPHYRLGSTSTRSGGAS